MDEQIVGSGRPVQSQTQAVADFRASGEKVDAGFSQETLRHQSNLKHRAILEELPDALVEFRTKNAPRA
jgi:hypothetical protein